MREIRFRVWNGKEMIYDVLVGKLGAFYVQGLDPKDTACISSFNTIFSKETPAMQYTGLKDKNGKELYEGDIIKFTNLKVELNFPDRREDIVYEGKVIFHQPWHGFALEVHQKSFEGKRYEQGFPMYLYSEYKHEIEVIGNIYENHELIEGEKI